VAEPSKAIDYVDYNYKLQIIIVSRFYLTGNTISPTRRSSCTRIECTTCWVLAPTAEPVSVNCHFQYPSRPRSSINNISRWWERGSTPTIESRCSGLL